MFMIFYRGDAYAYVWQHSFMPGNVDTAPAWWNGVLAILVSLQW